MSAKFSVATLAGASVVALVAGALLAPAVRIHKHKSVLITIQNKKCSQTADGISDALTSLRKKAFLFSGDSAEWKVTDKDHGATTFEINFPKKTPDGRVGTPFVDDKGNPKFTFTNQANDNQSGASPSTTPEGDYYYESVSVGGVPCDNPDDPGVHVDR